MTKPRHKGPGRPRKPNALSAAERMRRSRARKQLAGLRRVSEWVGEAPARYSDHMRLDARSLAMHALVARKLMADPGLLDAAKQTLARWKAQSPQPVPKCFSEWERILQRDREEVAGLLVSMTQEATRLRQSSPFAPLLAPEERTRIYAAFQ